MSRDARIASFVDLERYPIDNPDSPQGRSFVNRMREQLRTGGLCQLPGFLTEEAVTKLIREADSVEPQAYFGLTEATPYFNNPDPACATDHPRNTRTRRDLGLIASDLMANDCELKALYEWPPLRSFLSSILSQGRLYTLDDPYQKHCFTVMPQGAGHNWHFDDANFTVTLMLRKPAEGGDFECVPNLRTARDENYPGVREVLNGRRDNVQVISFEPGTLMIFRGRYSLHRVSPVTSPWSRVIAIFQYSTEPGWTGTPLTNELVFGPRVAISRSPSTTGRP